MKSTKVQSAKSLSLVVLLIIVGAMFTACSDKELVTDPRQDANAAQTYTMVVNATKGDDASTRALSLDESGVKNVLNATWAVGERVTVRNVTKSADLEGYLEAQSSGASTTLKGELTGTIANGDKLKLKFLSPSYASQSGTLEYIAANCDYAEATITVSAVSGGSITTSNATFTNQQAIVKFTLKDKGNSDAPINATSLTVNSDGSTYTVTPASATDELFVAVPAISSKTVTLTATDGVSSYNYEKTGATFENGKYYEINVKMTYDPLATPLTLEAMADGTTVSMKLFQNNTPTLEYRINNGDWTAISFTKTGTYSKQATLPSLNTGDKVSFRGSNTTLVKDIDASCKFDLSGNCYVYGNVMSLLDKDNYRTNTTLTADYTFYQLFISCPIYSHPSKTLLLPATTLTKSCYENMFTNYMGTSHLTTAPELPAMTLAESCYKSMFSGVTTLTTAPALPATTLAPSCYKSMFSECTGLSNAPTLSAMNLETDCYRGMFYGCTNLSMAPELPATTLATGCYHEMFKNCTSLSTAPTLPSMTMVEDCYRYMFSGCTSLATAPNLPATTMADECYYCMFEGCTNLTSVPVLPATTLDTYCYSSMFSGCTSLTSVPYAMLPATTLANNCYRSMFKGCTSLTKSPELPAPILTPYCYDWMFYGCTNLNNVTCLATDISASNCTSSWLYGVKSTGTFTKAASADWSSKTGASGIPTDWTVLNQ